MFTGIITDVGRVRSIKTDGDTRLVIETAYDTNGIEIPFPQRTVWVNQVSERPAAAVETTQIRDDLLENRSGSDGEE